MNKIVHLKIFSELETATFWRELYLLSSDWISTMVPFSLLSEVTSFDEMSLRELERKVLAVINFGATKVFEYFCAGHVTFILFFTLQ